MKGTEQYFAVDLSGKLFKLPLTFKSVNLNSYHVTIQMKATHTRK